MKQTPRLAAEALELRIAPAGIIHVSVRGGDLFLTGDPGDHVLEIAPGEDGSLVLIPLADTQLRVGRDEPFDQTLTLAVPIRDIHYTGGAGGDDLRLTDLHTVRHITTALGAGTNALLVTRSDVLGTLRVTGTGDFNSVLIQTGAEVTTIAGNLTAHFTRGGNNLFAEGAGLQVGGSVVYRSGSGEDYVNLVPNRLDILGSLDLSAGRGSGGLNASGIAGAAIRGPVLVRASPGEETMTVGFGSNGEYFFGGEVRIIGSSGGDDLALDAGKLTLAKGLTARLGAGANSVSLRSAEIAVVGTLTMTAEGTMRAEVIATNRILVEGAIAVTAKGGADEITVQGAGLVRGKVALVLGEGSSQSIFRGTEAGRLVLQGGLSITSGALADLFGDQAVAVEIVNVVLNGRATIKTGAGSDNIHFNGGAIHALVVVDTGGGVDSVTFFSQAGPLAVNAPVTVLMGGAEDFVVLGFTGAITATAPITIIGGAGTDHLDFLTYGNTLSTPPPTSGVELIA